MIYLTGMMGSGKSELGSAAARILALPFYSTDDKMKAAAALEKMGISDLEKRSFRALSGG